MRASYQGNTYAVEFDEQDTAHFSDHTDAPERTVVGRGAFVYDARTGDLRGAYGSAQGREEIEWLAFSQDAQDFGARALARDGIEVGEFDYAYCMPELNPGRRKHPYVGRRIELVYTSDPYTNLRSGDQGVVTGVDDAGTIHVDWDRGGKLGLVPGEDHFQWVHQPNPARISRTRGVKTMKGPYSEEKGYEPWIQKSGVLGEGFLTDMSKKDRHEALDACVAEYGYRSCLGRIMALERAKKGPYQKGKGVGAKYKKKLEESRKYLKKTYGGPGAFSTRKKEIKKEAEQRLAADAGAGYRAANPAAERHFDTAHEYLKNGESAMRSAQRHYERIGKTKKKSPQQERDEACERAKEAWRYSLLALSEVEHALHGGVVGHQDGRTIHQIREAAQVLQLASSTLLDRLGCPWAPHHAQPAAYGAPHHAGANH